METRIGGRQVTTLLLIAVGLAMVLVLGHPPTAWAATAATGGGNKIGKNIGDFFTTVGGDLYTGIIAIVAIVFLLNRRYNELALFVAAAMVVGWMVYDPTGVANTAKTIFQQITG